MIYIEREKELKKIIKKKLVLLDFYADWCGPCQMIAPAIDALEKENKNLTVAKINVDKHQDLAKLHGVMSIPTIEIYEKGKLKGKNIGYISKEQLEDLLK